MKADRPSPAVPVSVGERVTLGDAAVEYVVVSVDDATGTLELLRLKPGRIESNVPMSAVQKKARTGPRLVKKGD